MCSRHAEAGAGHPDSFIEHGGGHGVGGELRTTVAVPPSDLSSVGYLVHETPAASRTPHLRPDTVTRLLGWIDRRLADIEAQLGDEESMQSRGLHGTAVLHERRDTLLFMRAQIEQDR